jgi:hypothetical protein
MSICKDYFGGNWVMFFYRVPWTVSLRGLIDAAWYDDSKTGEVDEIIDCENLSDSDFNALQNLGKKK